MGTNGITIKIISLVYFVFLQTLFQNIRLYQIIGVIKINVLITVWFKFVHFFSSILLFYWLFLSYAVNPSYDKLPFSLLFMYILYILPR